MKRVTLFSLAAALLLAVVPSATAAPIQTFEAKSSSSVAGAPANITLGGTTSMPDGSKPPGVSSFTIDSPAGAKVDFNVATKCDRNQLLANGKCASSSKLDKSAFAKARVDFGGIGELDVSQIDVYRGASCAGGTVGCAYIYGTEPVVTGVTTVIDAQVYKRGSSYQISVADATLPTVLGVIPVLTELRVTVGAKRNGKSLYTNPSKCPSGGWTAAFNINYTDGSSNSITSAPQKCKKAPKRSAKKKKKKRR